MLKNNSLFLKAADFFMNLKAKWAVDQKKLKLLSLLVEGELAMWEIEKQVSFSPSKVFVELRQLANEGYIEKTELLLRRGKGRKPAKTLRITEKGLRLLAEIEKDFDQLKAG